MASTAAATGENEFIAKRQAMRDHAVRAFVFRLSRVRRGLRVIKRSLQRLGRQRVAQARQQGIVVQESRPAQSRGPLFPRSEECSSGCRIIRRIRLRRCAWERRSGLERITCHMTDHSRDHRPVAQNLLLCLHSRNRRMRPVDLQGRDGAQGARRA